MKFRIVLAGLLLAGFSSLLNGQQRSFDVSVNLSVSNDVAQALKPDGRVFLFLCQNARVEPRTQTWPNPWVKCDIFGYNVSGFSGSKTLKLDGSLDWIGTPEWTLQNVPEGEYFLQVLWDQDQEESGVNAPGNLYSTKQQIQVNETTVLDVALSQVIREQALVEHELVKMVNFKSDTLSRWWGKPMHMKAAVLLPGGYVENSGKAYPIRYNIAGYGGRYTRVGNLVNNKDFMAWWTSDEAPQIINVFLDGEGPFGDPYQMDSDNSGPYGTALINELIPYIEKMYRGTSSMETRFVDGCSTGGWVSLGLQLYYPDFFNGVFSYSPDAVEFENYQLIDIYRDENAFYNEFGYLRPVMRAVSGEPMLSMRDFIRHENVLGSSNTYVNSGMQIGSHTALYGPKGTDGLPKPMFDPYTGMIDREVAEAWKKYDFKLYAGENWEALGPELQGKIFIWMGDMDHFYLNIATRAFAEFLENTTNPVSDAEIVFSPVQGHCQQYSNKEVLLKIQHRIEQIEKGN